MPVDRRAAQRRKRRKQRRTAALVILLFALVAGIGVARHRRHGHAGVASPPAVKQPRKLAPPGPLPGYLLIADRGNNRMLLVSSSKRIFWTYPAHGVTPAMPFRFDDDTFFGPTFDRIISNQEDQHTIQIISFPGRKVLWRYGHVNQQGSSPGYLRTPDDAYLLPNGLVTVADAYNCRVLFINHAHKIVRQYGTTGVCRHNPPSQLGSINGATPLPDGGTLVSEINGSWVDYITAKGRLRWAVQAPVSYPSDPQLLGPGRILLADYARPGHAIIMTPAGRVLWRYGPASGPGMLDHPSLATRIAPGMIAINDDFRHRVVIVSIRTHHIVWQYGHTDTAGRAPGYLNTPDGLDLLKTADAQRLPSVRALLLARPAASTAAASPIQSRSPGYALPAPVERAVAVGTGSGIVIAGGLDAAGASTNGVFRLDPSSGRLVQLGTVPEPFHDAAAGLVGTRLFIFGGGASKSSSSVQSFDLAARKGSVVAHLPRPLSDVAAATVGGTIYLVGGYDDRSARAEIYATTDGTHFRLAGRLPHGLRYPAVAASGGRIVIAGGNLASGAPSAAIYAFDPGSGQVRVLGRLATATAHASAVTLGASTYIVGGVDAGGHTVPSATRVDVTARKVTPLALNVPVADAAVAQRGSQVFLLGGRRNGRTVADVFVLG
jgi:Kelch motif